MVEPALIGIAGGLAAAGIAIAGFWLTLGGRLGKTEQVAVDAQQTAAEAVEAAKAASASSAALSAAFGLYRENAIRDFVSRETLTELENRLVENSNRSEERLAHDIGEMSKRLDRLIEAGLTRSDVRK